MKRIQFLLATIVVAMMSSCLHKTEAVVDVEVKQKGEPLSGVTVYKFKDNGLGEGSTLFKKNASGSEKTNAGGVAHFKLKSPDDFTPSDVSMAEGKETNTFFFCTYDKNDERNSIVTVAVKTGDHKTVQLEVPEGLVNP